jgi:phosphatidylserine/phosphatidylglycerophosphate/cardiolipin synthase-like enzyme
MNAGVIQEGTSCWTLARAEQGSVLVDAEVYYTAFCNAALLARRYIYISGWQFDSKARLLRPDPGHPKGHPIELLPFLNYLCEAKPDLEVYITAWDYSLVYALEREWMQQLKFDFQAHARVHFEFLAHPEPGGCHHHKLVIVDGLVAFLGGLDLCDARWDNRRHEKNNADRIDVHGQPYKPFHDIQVALRGEVVGSIEQLFVEGWRLARGEPSELPSSGTLAFSRSNAAPSEPQPIGDVDPFGLERLTNGQGLPLAARRVAVSRTECDDSGRATACEIQALFERAIAAAERLIYVETQYFTSRAVAEALYHRLCDSTRSKLQIVLVMPDGADSPKEDFVLGNRQRAIRRFIADVAEYHGHAFRLLMSSCTTESERLPATFIHSKLMIVDDEFLTVGSANFTNRSMRVDREVNVTWQAELEAPADAERLVHDIRGLRASLLSEHSGLDDAQYFSSIDGLIERIDKACQHPLGKLRCQALPKAEADNPLLIAIFDPSGPLEWATIDQSLEEAFDFDEGFLKKTAKKVGQRLGVVDID